MFRGNRLLVAALAVVGAITVAIGCWTWPISPRLTDYGEANPSNGHYRAGGHKCQPSALTAIRDSGKRIRQTDACAEKSEEYRQQTNDLIQQTRAADAAKAQADIATQQLWTGWMQTLGGFLTLAAAVGAAIYARDAAAHTREANMIGRPPLLSAIQVRLDIDARPLSGCLLVINEGRSRAEITRSAVHVIVSDKGLPQRHPTAKEAGERDKDPIDVRYLSAGDVHWWQFSSPIILTPDQLRGISNPKGAWKIYIAGILRYQDTLGDFHHTLFCKVYDPARRRWMPVDDPDYEYKH